MRGMILAAGRGERMRELTADIPKSLIRVGGHYLIEYSLYSLAHRGITDIVINICYRGEQIKKALGNGTRYGVNIHYSEEKQALETGGGIFQALPLLGNVPFIVLSCDIVTDYSLQQLPEKLSGLAHLVLVSNPGYHTKGDFCLVNNKVYCDQTSTSTLTFGNIGVYHPELFANCQAGKFRLVTLLTRAITEGKVTGEHYHGLWYNLGTPEELNRATGLPDIPL